MSAPSDRDPKRPDQSLSNVAMAETIPQHKAALLLGKTLKPEVSVDPALSHTLPPVAATELSAAIKSPENALAAAMGETLPPEPSQRASLGETLGPEADVGDRGTIGPGAHSQTPLPGGADPESVVTVSPRGFPVANWDRYEFVSLLGEGGMGAVYKGRDKRLNRTVALKFIRGSDPNLAMRFIQEARAQARIDHPNVCKVYEVGQVEGQTYIAMAYIEGGPLDKVGQSMSLTEKVVVIKTVAEAMHEAHRLGIIHRDLKPANIMVERLEDGSWNPVVMDFGLARESGDNKGLTETGAVMGTPAYMSPEQARGESKTLDRRSDVYSIGATLYDLLIGIPPFDADSVVGLLIKVINEDPMPLHKRLVSVPPDLETIVMKAINKEPNHRYDSAKALAEDLGRYLSGEPILGKRLSMLKRIERRAKKHRALVAVSMLSAIVVISIAGSALRQYFANQRERQRLEAQARLEQGLAQHLGQEITKMEWVLRSARQLPLHDLTREKLIVRARMTELQKELATYGALTRGLAHYALGRGHMALHEYPQALTELELAIKQGKDSPDVQYALGFVLGKHFEKAMYEARLSGGGDWAKKQLKEIEPKYLVPALSSLQRSRAVKLDAPSYLEGLIAYFQRDYPAAIRHADAALAQAPWLYEAHKLAGDVHLEQALQARDAGKYDDAEKQFAAAVKRYQDAASIGQSDGEVYEGLAESWVRQIEMGGMRGTPSESAYKAAVVASEKIATVEPQSVTGRLKKGYATLMTMGMLGAGTGSASLVTQCMTEMESLLKQDGDNPYARDVAAGCYAFAADSISSRGENPEPSLRRALEILEPAVNKNPRFLWGLNDLASIYTFLGEYYALHGNALSLSMYDKAISYQRAALALDGAYLIAFQNVISTLAKQIFEKNSIENISLIVANANAQFEKCRKVSNQFQQCYINMYRVHISAAARSFQAALDPQPSLRSARQVLDAAGKLEGSNLDVEQFHALGALVNARHLSMQKREPDEALREVQGALSRCLAINAKDGMCLSLAVRADWVAADWAFQTGKSGVASLISSLQKALHSTKQAASFPDSWQVLAESYLRMSKLQTISGSVQLQHVFNGLTAIERLFLLNPHHALGHGTKGALLLRQAALAKNPASRKSAAQSAVASFEQALHSDPLVANENAAALAQAKALLASQ